MIIANCNQCNSEFETRQSYIDMGEGKFCIRKCSAEYNNVLRNYTLTCEHCKISYESKNRSSKFCSRQCGKLYREFNTGKKVYKRETLARRVKKLLEDNSMPFSCFECGWDLDVPDVHHILNKSEGGSDEFSNLTCLCPNHHRLAHRNKLLTLTSVSERIGLSHHPE